MDASPRKSAERFRVAQYGTTVHLAPEAGLEGEGAPLHEDDDDDAAVTQVILHIDVDAFYVRWPRALRVYNTTRTNC
jgi:hypothetical protein